MMKCYVDTVLGCVIPSTKMLSVLDEGFLNTIQPEQWLYLPCHSLALTSTVIFEPCDIVNMVTTHAIGGS